VVEFFGPDRVATSSMIGGSAVARWRVSGVNAVEIQIVYPDQTTAAVYPDQPPEGSVFFPLTEDLRRFGLPVELTFRLWLPGFGELDHFVMEIVAPIPDAAEAITFTAAPASVHPGDSVTLTWEVTGAERIAIAATDPGNFPFANLTDLPPSGSAVIVIPLDIRPTTGWPAAVSFGMWVTLPADGRMLIGSSSTYVLVSPPE
jgi:hypothetical protein